MKSIKRSFGAPWLVLLAIWVLSVAFDRTWVAMDGSVPSWDMAFHLNGALSYRDLLSEARILDSAWWAEFWQLSKKNPPFTYGLIALIFGVTGPDADAATLVHVPMTALLLVSVFVLGRRLADTATGLWAAMLCLVFPKLFELRVEVLLDYPLTVFVTAAVAALTFWRFARTGREAWAASACFGLAAGLAMLAKPTPPIYLMVPFFAVLFQAGGGRRLVTLAQAVLAVVLAFAVAGQWYVSNWLTILTTGKSAAVNSGLGEGDPQASSLAGWLYYVQKLPEMVGWPILALGFAGVALLAVAGRRPARTTRKSVLIWLGICLVGTYAIISIIPNKDARYSAPILPTLSVLFAIGLCGFRGWQVPLRWVALGLGALPVLIGLPQASALREVPAIAGLAPNGVKPALIGVEWPHQTVINRIRAAQPYVDTTLGVTFSTAEVDQFNLTFLGRIGGPKVHARSIPTRRDNAPQDLRALDWFLTRELAGASLSGLEAEVAASLAVDPEFEEAGRWPLPDGETTLILHGRRHQSIEVRPVAAAAPAPVRLEAVTVAPVARAGAPLAVTYTWSGKPGDLRDGLVLLDWVGADGRWLHDHGIAGGYLAMAEDGPGPDRLQVTEHMAMLPAVPPGAYRLRARYVNRVTGERYPLDTPVALVELRADWPAEPAPKLDLLTLFRQFATALPIGPSAFEPIFEGISRVSMYDPDQDYVPQAEMAARLREADDVDRLARQSEHLLALALQRDVAAAIPVAERFIAQMPDNAFAHAYLGLFHVYLFSPSAARVPLAEARRLAPDSLEIEALSGVAALMQGRLPTVWRVYWDLKAKGAF